MSIPFAICNETFGNWEHARICDFVATIGYTGLEIAPFTLGRRITDVSPEQRRQLRRQTEAAGVKIVALHYLLAKTEGLHATSADSGVRRTTGRYLGDLAYCCRDLGADVMVFGSPLQRKIPDGISKAQADDFMTEVFNYLLPILDETGVRLGIEPLGPTETNYINTCAEALDLVAKLNHPKVALHMDVKAMATESRPTPELIQTFVDQAIHIHANDASGRGPGMGQTDFRPIFAALKERNYQGWISVEVFDYSPDPETIARNSMRYMQKCLSES